MLSEKYTNYNKLMQIVLLKAIKLHKELEYILVEASLHKYQEVWMPEKINNLNTKGDEVIEDTENTLVKKMQNIYKQAKVILIQS